MSLFLFAKLILPNQKVQTTMDTYSHMYTNKHAEVARQLDALTP